MNSSGWQSTIRWLITLLGVTMLASAVARADEAMQDYRLGSGDRVKIVVFGQPELSGEFSVDGRGRLSLPLIQAVTVEGLTLRETERAITDKLHPEFLKNPRVSVDIATYRPIYVLGEVRTPGSYAYVSGMTVLQAVALAGGYTYRAKKSGVRIVRAARGTEEKERANELTRLQPGDVVEVPERFF
jgi:polysaccharide export outer membrane protein